MQRVFQELNRMVQEGVVDQYAVGGSVGYICYVEPFFTEDIDVFVLLPQTSILVSMAPIYAWAAKRGFEPDEDALLIHGEKVQFLVAPTTLEEEAIQNARQLRLFGETVSVMSPEFLVATSLRAGRAKDYAKIEKMLDEYSLDESTLMDLITRFGLQDRWQRAAPSVVEAAYRTLVAAKRRSRRRAAQQPFSLKAATLMRLRKRADQLRNIRNQHVD